MRILIIEDQNKVAHALQEGLEREGFGVSLAGDGEEGFFLASSEQFDLIILDLGLPGRDGLEILKAMRQRKIAVPVLILTARDSVEARVTGLEYGGDDYLVKPFAFPELLARVHALLRRVQSPAPTKLFLEDLELDLAARRASRGSHTIPLTVKELELLEYFLRNKNRVISRDMIARDVWKTTSRVTPLDNVIDVHIAHLRRKLDAPFEPKLLHTLRGVGFILSKAKP